MEYSAAAALMAGVPRNRILNFMPVAELLGWAQSVREQQGVADRDSVVTSLVPKRKNIQQK
jgi:hypothetical protein